MQVVLVMFRADGERRSFSVTRDMTVIGRREDCDLRIPLGEISRKHCRLVKDGDTLRLEDLGSSNGTYVNGERIQEADIQPGDTIQVGPVAFVVQIDGAPADDELQPVLRESAPVRLEDEEHEPGAATMSDDDARGSADEMQVEEEVEVLDEAGNGNAGHDETQEAFDPMAALEGDEEQDEAFEFPMEEIDPDAPGAEDAVEDSSVEVNLDERQER